MNTFLLTAAIVFTTYAWIRFCDLVVKPWLAELATADYDAEALDEYVIRSALTGKYSNAEIDATIARARGM